MPENKVPNLNNDASWKKSLSAVSLGLELGFMIALPLVVFLLAGIFLDKKMGTMPLFLIISLLLNAAVTILGVKKIILPFLEKRSQNKSTNN